MAGVGWGEAALQEGKGWSSREAGVASKTKSARPQVPTEQDSASLEVRGAALSLERGGSALNLAPLKPLGDCGQVALLLWAFQFPHV